MIAQAILTEWNRCRGWLAPALVEDREDEVINDLLSHRAQLWAGEHSALVTQLVKADEPYVLVWLGGGRLSELLAIRPVVESWARIQGAKAARINGRTGWAKALAKVGFVPDGDELRKAL